MSSEFASEMLDEAEVRHAAEIEAWQDATGLECGGDPGGVTPAGLRRYLEKVESERDALRAQLASAQATAGSVDQALVAWKGRARESQHHARHLLAWQQARQARMRHVLRDREIETLEALAEGDELRAENERLRHALDEREEIRAALKQAEGTP